LSLLRNQANQIRLWQEIGLFAGTVAENLAMFVPDITRATMETTLRAVGLLDEIYALPQGLATPLSNESAVLSTGQRRRLIVARALCRNPRLLLLDEVTANLDPQSEMELVRSLMQIPTAKIFVTHSANLLSSVDRILRVGDAEVREVPRKSRSAKSPELVLA
jgi:ATP-binding cassette subfamily B protein RaxB